MNQHVLVRAIALLTVAGCGDNLTPPDPPVPVSVSARISGLAGTGLALRLNGGEIVEVGADGRVDFTRQLMPGSPYEITVAAQPTEPAQTCTVANGTGIVGDEPIEITVACAVDTFTVGGAVSGLAGTGLVLENNGTDPLAIDADGAFTFARPVDSGTAFAVTIQTQPTSPMQTCTVAGASGVMGGGHVTSVVVDCATDRFVVGGIVSGLAGTLVVQNNDGDDVTLTANGAFAFPTTVASGETYAVTVKTQPGTPSQTCTVSAGSGDVVDMDISSVRIDCTTNQFAVRGTVTGLDGQGLVLQANGGDNLSIAANGTFAFPTTIASGSAYAVSVFAQPSQRTQTCTVSQGTGTIGGEDVTDVVVACETRAFDVRATVSGLAGSGLVLRNAGGDDLPVTANGVVTFGTKISSGDAYAVTVHAQPTSPSQTCTVSAGTGTVGSGDISSVSINCATDRFTIGGTVSGLAGTVVLHNNGGDALTLNANGNFAFPATVASGETYTVSVSTQPGAPSQTCTVAHGHGGVTASNITNVGITCTTNRYAVRGTVTGLDGSGLVLRNNGGDALAITQNGPFAFSTTVASGAAYGVTVAVQPTNRAQTCTVTHGAGLVGGNDVADVQIACTTNTYSVGGTVSGVAGTGLVLRNINGEDLAVGANGTFAFTRPVRSGDPYAVTIAQQPVSPWQTCQVTTGAGSVTSAAVTTVAVTCTTNAYTVGGTVTGFAPYNPLAAPASRLRLANGAQTIEITADGTFTFPTAIKSGTAFAVTVAEQPSYPQQACTVSGGEGLVGGANITSVTVNCTTLRYAIGGTLSGLTGPGVILKNGADMAILTANGTFAFPQTVASGGAYNVTVSAQPAGQTCVVAGGIGQVYTSAVTTVEVTCSAIRYAIGGNVRGLAAGSQVTLSNNGADLLVVTGNQPFTFPVTVPRGGTYAVQVVAQPGAPAQTCIVTSGSGTVGMTAITNVDVACSINRYALGGTVSGLPSGRSVVLTNNNADDHEVTTNGVFYFTRSFDSGSTYSVGVRSQPAGYACTVAQGAGTIGGDNVTSVAVTCVEDAPACGGYAQGCCTDSDCDAGLACTSGTCTAPSHPCPPGYYMDPFSTECVEVTPTCPPDMYWDPSFGCMPSWEPPPPMCGMPGEMCCDTWCDFGYTCSPWNTCEAGGWIPGG